MPSTLVADRFEIGAFVRRERESERVSEKERNEMCFGVNIYQGHRTRARMEPGIHT